MAGINTEQETIGQPAVEVSGVELQTDLLPLTQVKKRTHILPSGFGGPLLAAFITSIALVLANAWIVPTVARHQKRIDRMYQAMFDTASSAGLLYGYTWNMWNERQKLVGVTNKPLEDLQQIEAKADALALQLPLIFDASIAAQWKTIVDGYSSPDGIVYPITHPKEFPTLATEKAMNEKLTPLSQLADEVLRRMQAVIRETENRLW